MNIIIRGIDVNGNIIIIFHSACEFITNFIGEGAMMGIGIGDMIDGADGHESAGGTCDEDFAGGADEVSGEK